MTDIERLRSTRLEKPPSQTMKRARQFRIINGPEASDTDRNSQGKGGMQIVPERSIRLVWTTLHAWQHWNSSASSILAGTSALLGQQDQARLLNGHRRDMSSGQLQPEGRPRT